MIGNTTALAIKAILFLSLDGSSTPVAPRLIADQLGASPTYTAKVMRSLVRAGILRAYRGAQGGVTLSRPSEEITMRAVLEACQGQIFGDLCSDTPSLDGVCSFHRAMAELHDSIIEVLSKWSIADLAQCPVHTGEPDEAKDCRMFGVVPNNPDFVFPT
jgi:Rrf2 family protein